MEQTLIDRILVEATGEQHQEEIKRARDVYFEHLQDLREDDPSYERLTSCFLNWYVFDRPMDNGKGTPLQVFAATKELTAQERALVAALAANIHSLFEFIRVGKRGLYLRELFSNEPFRVSERRKLAGLENGDILEARLLPSKDQLVFSTGAFVLHPREARHLVLQAVERSRLQGFPSAKQLIRRLQALSFRYTDRFRQRVPVEKVYGEIGSFTGSGSSRPAAMP